MKPEALIPPFSRNDQRIVIQDRVWYIPQKIPLPNEFSFPGWNHPDLFANDLPVAVEYCSGNGAWIAQKALENPRMNWVAVEMKFSRVRKIWSKIKNFKLQNLLIIWGEALAVTQHFFPNGAIDDVYINFPDPWPKKRHAKNRLIQTEFLDQLSRILKEEKSLTFVTDDAAYSEWTIGKLNSHPDFVSIYPEPYYLSEQENYGTSYFDELWRAKGRSIRYHRFQKQKKKN